MTKTESPRREPMPPIQSISLGKTPIDDEEEEVEIRISPTGSVLAPSANPYDKIQKLRQANAQLMASRLPPRPPGRVRFNEAVIPEETTTSSRESSPNSSTAEPLKSAPTKILLVTVPSGFSDDLEVVNSDEEIIDETDFRDNEIEKAEDLSDASPKFKKALRFQDYSVDMKSVDEDYEETVEDLTTTLVSLCRMTSECEDTDLENNITRLKRVEVEPIVEEMEDETGEGKVEEDEGQLSDEDDSTEEGPHINTNGKTVETDHADNFELSPCLVKRAASTLPIIQNCKDQDVPSNLIRPSTTPAKRVCFKNQWAYTKLPNYNGLKSEYGLSAEQLEERKKRRVDAAKRQRQHKEDLYKEERRKQKENELMFATWLVKKKKEAALKAARRKQLPPAFHFKTLPAPTSHLEKMGLLRKKVLARREHTCYSLQEFFKNAKPHEQKTYKIYLGVCVE